MYNKLTLAECI